MKIKLIRNRFVGDNEKPFIIAEIGSNHNGDMDLAQRLIGAAKEAGADCVKFQSWSKETLWSRKSFKDDIELEETAKEYAISEVELLQIKNYAGSIGIDCISTPFSKGEVDFLIEKMAVDFIKVASMDLNNYSFLDYIASTGKPIVLSTGLGTLAEIDRAIQGIEGAGNQQIVILHCVALYPPEDYQVNLRVIDTLTQVYPYPVGFSDHTLGTCLPLAAIAKGACIIEKHFTIDKNMKGWDHKISANPEEMALLVKDGNRIHDALGLDRITRVDNGKQLKSFRRSIVASRKILKGEEIAEDMLDFKRPGTGLPPEAINFLLGKNAKRDIEFDEIIELTDF